jgi:hypothetical protein
MKYEMETMREIWPEKGDGEHIEVGPDRDGLQCVEIRQKEPDNKISSRITFSVEAARLVAHAMLKCADEISSANLLLPSISAEYDAD